MKNNRLANQSGERAAEETTRFTCELPAVMHRRAKMVSAATGDSLKDVLAQLLEYWVRTGGAFPQANVLDVVGEVCAGDGFGVVPLTGQQVVVAEPYDAPCPGVYAVRVRGESMDAAGGAFRFADQDYAVLCPKDVFRPQRGAIVHVEVDRGDGERDVYLRQYVPQGDKAEFRALAVGYDDFTLLPGEYEIRGSVVGKVTIGQSGDLVYIEVL